MAKQIALPPLMIRTLSALVLIPAALGVIYAGGWIYAAVIILFAALMLDEWIAITEGKADRLLLCVTFPALIAAAVAMELGYWHHGLAAVGAAAVVAGAVSTYRHGKPLWAILGAVYVGIPVISLIWLRQGGYWGFVVTLFTFLVVWATDIGAYFAGKLIGGPKLAPMISPKKTWAGLAGGIVAAALTASAVGWWQGVRFDAQLISLGAVLAIWSQVGDLMESALKRRFGVKDSGTIIPGHGGVLDRVDGLVFVAPVMALMWSVG